MFFSFRGFRARGEVRVWLGLGVSSGETDGPSRDRLAIVFLRLTYPFVYMLKGIGLGGSNATAFEQVGYSFADIIAKAAYGIMIWRIAHEKTLVIEAGGSVLK